MKHRLITLFGAGAVWLTGSAFSGRTADLLPETDGAAAAMQQQPATPDPPELPLPAIPPTLRQPAQRAGWLIRHFWDEVDFRDPLRSHNETLMEQHFVNFVSLFPHADPTDHTPAVDTLMRRAEADGAAFRLVAGLAEKYLFETDSPLRDDALYLLFLDRIVEAPVLDRYERMRPQVQQEALRKNRPGMTAADFPYVTREGERTTLHQTETSGPLLLIFYDPTCGHCQEVMAELRRDSQVAEAVASGELEVLAICVDGTAEALKVSSASLPETWLTGYEEGTIYDEELYALRSMPTLYLLDAQKRILRKEPTPATLFE